MLGSSFIEESEHGLTMPLFFRFGHLFPKFSLFGLIAADTGSDRSPSRLMLLLQLAQTLFV